MKILGISGSLRKEAYSTALLKAFVPLMPEGVVYTVLTLNDVPMYDGDLDTDKPPQGVAKLRKEISEADAIVFMTPEYNYGPSGAAKNAIDWASRPQANPALKNKHVVVMSSSPGALGGVRAIPQLHSSLLGIGSKILTGPQVNISAVHTKLKDGKLIDESTIKFVTGRLADLISNAKK